MAKNSIVVIGGCKSGKSRFALELVNKFQTHPKKFFIATGMPIDEEMSQRIKLHQKERDPSWITVEEPVYLGSAIKRLSKSESEPCTILVDCLTVWLSNMILKDGWNQSDIEHEETELLSSISQFRGAVIIVTNEVGTGIVPDNKLARLYRDLAGMLNQKVAQAVEHVFWVVSGIPVQIKGKPLL